MWSLRFENNFLTIIRHVRFRFEDSCLAIMCSLRFENNFVLVNVFALFRK
jgi:hypothetical protein